MYYTVMATTLADFVRTTRLDLGLTQEQLDEAAGMSRGYTGMLEIGRAVRPKPKTIKALADALHVPATTLSNMINEIPNGPDEHDVIQEILRLDQMPSRAARLKAFRDLPPDVRRAIRQIARDLDGVDDPQDAE